jgi:hypothetical protein
MARSLIHIYLIVVVPFSAVCKRRRIHSCEKQRAYKLPEKVGLDRAGAEEL